MGIKSIFNCINRCLSFFSKNQHSAPEKHIDIPKPGDQYYFAPIDESPFKAKDYSENPATVLEYMDGWVRYRMGKSNGIFNDERLELSSFLEMYVKLENTSIED